jgi:hypothetical protein
MKITAEVFAEADKVILKFTWKCKRPRVDRTILKKNEVEGLRLFNFRVYKKATVRGLFVLG